MYSVHVPLVEESAAFFFITSFLDINKCTVGSVFTEPCKMVDKCTGDVGDSVVNLVINLSGGQALLCIISLHRPLELLPPPTSLTH